MRFQLTLAQKGLVLIAVPLLFQLLLMGTLGYLHSEAEKQAATAENSKGIVDAVNQIEKDFFDIFSNVSDQNDAQFFSVGLGSLIRDFDGQMAILVKLTKDDPRKREIVMRSTASAREVEALFYHTRDLYMQGGFKDKSEERQTIFRQSRKLIHQLLDQGILEMAHDEKARARQAPELEAQFRQAIHLLLVAGSALTIAMTLTLVTLYNRQVVKRLGIAVDNSLLLASGKQLHRMMRGNDEIAKLDQAFHSMADALAEASEKERAVITNAHAVIFSLDERGTFINISPGSQAILGYEAEELLGSKFINLAVAAEHRDVLNALKLATEGGAEPPFETRVQRKDGRTIDILCSAHWSKKDKTVFCVAHDISERKQAERLRQEIVQMVSHDLKTPLSTVRSFLEMLDAGMFGDLSGNGPKLLKLAENSTARMLTLIRDLLDIEKLEAGMLQLTRNRMPLQYLFEQAAGSVSSQAADSQVAVTVVATELIVYADSDRILQVLVNLLSNAIKFSEPNDVVTLSATVKENIVQVSVSDTGRGIPREKIESIFDRFSQVKLSDATEKGGSGLGLAICKALVGLHGGTISVTSVENQGSTFTFTLPTAEPAQDKRGKDAIVISEHHLVELTPEEEATSATDLAS